MRPLAVLLAAGGIDITPSASGLPGSSTLIQLVDGLQFDAEIAAIAAMIISAAVWALSSHSNNYQGASRGKVALLASGFAAILIGFGPALVEALFGIGQAAH